MSIHFTVSLGLIIACAIHAFIFLNFDINQEVKIIKKEEVLTVVLIKLPVIKPPVEMPIEIPLPPVVNKKKSPPQKPKKSTKSIKAKEKTTTKSSKNKNITITKETIPEPEKNDDHPSIVTEKKFEEQSIETSTIEENIPEAIPSTVKAKVKFNGMKNCSHCPKPQYPFVAKQRGIEGSVKLALKIDETGAVIDAKILASDPEDTFEEAALEAVLQWRNLPEQFYNTTVEQKIDFKLNN